MHSAMDEDAKEKQHNIIAPSWWVLCRSFLLAELFDTTYSTSVSLVLQKISKQELDIHLISMDAQRMDTDY